MAFIVVFLRGPGGSLPTVFQCHPPLDRRHRVCYNPDKKAMEFARRRSADDSYHRQW